MQWFLFLPVALGGVVALAQLSVTLLVEHAERQRRLRHPARRREIFRPVLIQGGKAQAPPVGGIAGNARAPNGDVPEFDRFRSYRQ